MTDLKIIETGNGGDIVLAGKDLQTVQGFGNMIYLALWGGNPGAPTPTNSRPVGQQYFDWWGNALLMPNNPAAQFNSLTEDKLRTTALNSSGRIQIEQAINKDLDFMRAFATVTVSTEIISTDRLKISVKIQQPDNLESNEFVYIWDGTRKDLEPQTIGGKELSPTFNGVVNFIADDTTPQTGISVQFTDLTTDNPSSWFWEFGDGATPSTSILQNPTVVYDTDGARNVKLTASRLGVDKDLTKTNYITASFPTDALATAFYAKAVTLGVTVIEPLRADINRYLNYLRLSGEIANTEFMHIDAVFYTEYSEADRKILNSINLMDSTQVHTLRNDYAGAHVAGLGWAASDNTKKFGILMPFNPSTASKWARNSASYAVIFLGSTDTANHWSVGSGDSGFAAVNLLTRTNHGEGEMVANLAVANLDVYTYIVGKANTPGMWSMRRTGANVFKEYVNDALVSESTQASTALVNSQTGRMGAYAQGWVDGFYSENPQAAIWGGNGNIDHSKIFELVNKYLLSRNATAAYFNKNIYVVGDSIHSAGPFGNYSAMVNRTIANLNDHWTATNTAISGRRIVQINSDFATYTAPFYKSWWDENIFLIHASTNDISGGFKTGAQCYTEIVNAGNAAKAAGWTKIIISAVLPRADVMGVSQATFDAELAALSALLLADFNTIAGTNLYTPSSATYGTLYINGPGNSKFSNPNDVTYFDSKLHLTNVGSLAFADELFTPAIQLLT